MFYVNCGGMHVYICIFIQIYTYIFKQAYIVFYTWFIICILEGEKEKKGNKKCSTMGIICEIDTVNSFSLPFHYILVCQSRNLMALTAHHFQDVFNNPY